MVKEANERILNDKQLDMTYQGILSGRIDKSVLMDMSAKGKKSKLSTEEIIQQSQDIANKFQKKGA